MTIQTQNPTGFNPMQTRVLGDAELDAVVGGGDKAVLTTVMTNLANMRHEMLKAVANNLRG